jgi:hypothetical protein
MSIEFLDSVWIDVTVRGAPARMLVREPNALEGVRYFSAIQKWRDRLESEETALESMIQVHLNLLAACVLNAEGFAVPYPADGTLTERLAWLVRLPWGDVSGLASKVAMVGYPANFPA